MGGSLESLHFDNSFVRALPADAVQENYVRQVRGAAFSPVLPTAVSNPRLVAFSPEVAELLGLSRAACESLDFAEVFAGNQLLSGMQPHAACYGGHQFGNWAGQLGDGRAISLGEAVNARGQRWELQLKGAGPTPYSRTADGRAVLRSSLREFLCSEAMHHLGVPTTRALSLVTTGEGVLRDLLYDGNARREPGAVVCRVAPSFIRFGNFELFAAREEHGLLSALTDYTIRTHYPELGAPSRAVYARWFEEICRRTAELVTHWMRVGFVHGVMNTDNMSILGLTIDYGPYGFVEPFDPAWTPNITDAAGRRYRYGSQPQVAHWNLVRLAQALLPLFGSSEPLEAALRSCAQQLELGLHQMFAKKLGLRMFHAESHFAGDALLPADSELVDEMLAVLGLVETDMTLFFRKLADLPSEPDPNQRADEELMAPLLPAYYAPAELSLAQRASIATWLRRYLVRVRAEDRSDAERRARMNAVNPKYVPRNYLAQLAIDRAEQGDFAYLHELFDVLRHPYDEQPDKQHFAEKRPDWARNRAGCAMLSCSS
jgi:uncharacterized protein YdiU (UPF0061 family)